MQKLISNKWKIMIKVKNQHRLAMSQKSPVNNFEWIEDACQFNEQFVKTYNEQSDEWYFIEVDVQYPEILPEFHNGLPISSVKMEIEKV